MPPTDNLVVPEKAPMMNARSLERGLTPVSIGSSTNLPVQPQKDRSE
ncbi:hypothetical protein ABC974_05390 [Sphingomonas oligophenolica]|uniref:Uncharacterized protein n=1 Tax=Sphingomonas oligophenolica TaxID=301154 RepID=A0ABU9XZU3_9SPHN